MHPESQRTSGPHLRPAPVLERPPLVHARARLSNLRGASAAEILRSDSPRTLGALLDPWLTLELVGQFQESESLRFTFLRTPRSWRFEIEAAWLADAPPAAATRLEQLLNVLAPQAVFKCSAVSDVVLNTPAVLEPLADRIALAGASVLLPANPNATPCLRRALATARASDIDQLAFELSPFVLGSDSKATINAAYAMLAAQPESKDARLDFLRLWREASQGVIISATATASRPLTRHEHANLTAALFGRVSRNGPTTTALDLRMAAPSGALPLYRFWPTAEDLERFPAPPAPAIADEKGAVTLGCDDSDELIRLGGEDRMRHLYVLGGTGAGKTSLIANMIIEDARKGEGVLLIDPHGDLADTVHRHLPATRRDDLIWIDLGAEDLAWRLDLFGDANTERGRDQIANQLITLFRQFYASTPDAFGPQFENWFRNALFLLMSAKDQADRTLIKFQDVFCDEAFREKLLDACDDRRLVQFWRNADRMSGEHSLENFTTYITSKMTQLTGSVLARAFIGGDKPRLDLRAAMDARKIVLIRLSKGVIGEHSARFLGALLLAALSSAAMSRASIRESERTPFRVYIDEFQNLATQTAADMLAEARKYGLAQTLSNQSLSQIAAGTYNPAAVGHAVLANCGSLAFFRLGLADAQVAAAVLDGVSTREFTQLGVGDMIVRRLVRGIPQAPERVHGLPPLDWEGAEKLPDERDPS